MSSLYEMGGHWRGARQPVHTVYVGAHLFTTDTVRELGAIARSTLEAFAPDARSLAHALRFELPAGMGERIYARVLEKLRREPVEDIRIDFEDGYGSRIDSEEDRHAHSVAEAVAQCAREKTLPSYLGIRIKPLTEELRARGVRTLETIVRMLVERPGKALPAHFVVTLPKVTTPSQVSLLADELDGLEKELRLASNAISIELMVETPLSIFDQGGAVALPRLVQAGRGRVRGAHFGTYDYTASLGITAAHQRMRHGACDFARNVMQVSLAGTGVWLSDGSTAVLPVPPHPGETSALSPDMRLENELRVHRAWSMHFADVLHSLDHGFYQGWDLHAAQLVSRYAALYAFFLEDLDAVSERVRNFLETPGAAGGELLDDPATGQGLHTFLLRGINCGAFAEEEVVARTGLTLVELHSGGISTILRNRSQAKTSRP